MDKKLYIIAGCNGAGKTTASRLLLPSNIVYINADDIAKELRPNDVASVAFLAGRMMLTQIDDFLKVGYTFSFETTLSTRSYHETIKFAQLIGYRIILIYFWLNDSQLAIQRVSGRVQQGGHNIEAEVVKRRYHRSISNLVNIYIPLVDELLVFDNSEFKLDLIAEKPYQNQLLISNFHKWNKLMKSI